MSKRNLVTTYYGPHAETIRVTRSIHMVECLRNIMGHLAQGHFQKDRVFPHVVEVVDEDNYNELVLVVTDFPGEELRVPFRADPLRPTLVTGDV